MCSASQIGRQQNSFSLMSVLSFAVLEWLLMFFLFINALFSYLVMRFARLCKLQTPCLICSRLDHVFENEKPGFYRKLICDSHKSEISSLAYCHVHRNLADVNKMCERCFLSYATEKKSFPETLRSLMGRLGTELDNNSTGRAEFENLLNGDDAAEVPLPKKDFETSSLVMHRCSCCSKLFKNKSNVVSSLHNSSREESFLHDQDRLSMKTKNSLESASSFQLRSHERDFLPHVGCNEVKATSDFELDNRLSDNDDGIFLHKDVNEDIADRSLKPEPIHATNFSMPLSDDTLLEKSIQGNLQLHVGNCNDATLAYIVANGHDSEENKWSTTEENPAYIVANGHDSEENKWSTTEEKPDPSALSQAISKKVSTEFSNSDLYASEDFGATGLCTTSIGEYSKPLCSTEQNENTSQVSSDQGISVSLPMDLNDASKLVLGSKCSSTPPTVVESITEKMSSTTLSDEHLKPSSSTETNETTNQFINDTGVSGSMPMDLNDAYKLAIGSKSSLTTPRVAEVITGRESTKVYEDLKLLISQFSASRGLESPWTELIPSPRLHMLADDKLSDTSSSAVLQNITTTLSIERNESGFESLEGSIVSEIEGESALDRLKRQVELDRKSIYLLYKELEEERNASAIAANQAMAMITRLQEVKAEMQMEALQYQRMMEQQAEYDQEALQRSNELLARREKEMQDLVVEVESYRKRINDEIS